MGKVAVSVAAITAACVLGSCSSGTSHVAGPPAAVKESAAALVRDARCRTHGHVRVVPTTYGEAVDAVLRTPPPATGIRNTPVWVAQVTGHSCDGVDITRVETVTYTTVIRLRDGRAQAIGTVTMPVDLRLIRQTT